MSNERLFLSCPTVLILLLCLTEICSAQNNSLCVPYFCGNINISYPFRLRGDPANCGHPSSIFVLECQKNQTILHSNSRRYHVQAITYSNFSMRISDPGLDSTNYSSCPIYSYSFSEMEDDLYSGYIYRDFDSNVDITFLNCLSPVTNPLYVPNPFCGNTSAFSNSSRIYSYLLFGTISLSDLEESCTYDNMALVSSPLPLPGQRYSYSQIHDILAYGFQLLWYPAMCTECYESKGSCSVEGSKTVCHHYCDEHTPLDERDFSCKLEYYAPYLFIAALAVAGLIGLRFILGVVIGCIVYKWKRRSSFTDESQVIEELLRHQANLVNYSYREIKRMTTNFKAKLYEGPHGTVYRGKLRSGPLAAVKMLMNSSASDKEFISYVSTVSKISHPNIMKLIGFCIRGRKRALVYEFMQCGSLERRTFLQDGMKLKPCLSYEEMFKISVGIARGIQCLHSSQIVHLGIKPQNILLDEDFNPKISDSGLSKLYSNYQKNESVKGAKGKMGFIPPEVFYKNIGEISTKADVYSFGMLVLEMAAKLRTLNPHADRPGQVYFPSWIYNQLNKRKNLEIQDAEETEKEMVKTMIVVALWCIQIRAEDRPSMNEVVGMLEGKVEMLQMPSMPFQRAMANEEFMEESYSKSRCAATSNS